MGVQRLRGLDTPALRITTSRVTIPQMFVGRLCQTLTVMEALHRNALQFAK